MYQYIDTFLIENVSMCRYKYISKVSDTYTVSDTKGLVVQKWIQLVLHLQKLLQNNLHQNLINMMKKP